jgi:hypothetical protein
MDKENRRQEQSGAAQPQPRKNTGFTTKSAKDTKVSDIFDFKLRDLRG